MQLSVTCKKNAVDWKLLTKKKFQKLKSIQET